MSRPRLVTFATDAAAVGRRLAAGADHLVIDDPRLSLRAAVTNERRDTDWSTLDVLARTARDRAPSCRLSLNCDLLCHDDDLPRVAAAMQAAAAAGFDAIRIQDPGLIRLRDQLDLPLALELATETGNACVASVAAQATEGFDYQVLSNDWPAPDIAALRQRHPTIATELLVHGPILLQYSRRRQLTAYLQPEADPTTAPATGWQEVVVDERRFPFADNRHGTVMLHAFDRSLYPCLDRLWTCQLTAWLIDGRGQPQGYTCAALRAFAAARDALMAGGDGFDEAMWEKVQAVGARPCKPGFFIANNTDHCFEDHAQAHEDQCDYGEIVDVIRGESLLLALKFDLPPLSARDWLELVTPDGRHAAIDWSRLSDLHGRPITEAGAGDLIRLPWSKGMVPASRLCRAPAQPNTDA